MKRKRFTEEQIAYALAQETAAKQSPRSVGALAFPSKLFIAEKRKFGSMGVVEVRRLK